MRLFMIAMLFLIAGCETQQMKQQSTVFTAADAIVDSNKYRGRDVIWGGTLISTTNRKRETVLELLSYPVVSGRPRLSRPSQGRVLAIVPGFLDPAEYKPGKSIVVEGLFTGVRHGYVGGTSTTYAVVEARKAELRQSARSGYWPPNLHIGIGVFKQL